MLGPHKKRPKTKPSWSDIKNRLADFDRTGLMQLIADLYAFNKDNQSCMHARFTFLANALDDYKKRIRLALYPDIGRRNADPSVATAKKAISEYKKAVGDSIGIIELRVFWCEIAVEFSMDHYYVDVGYLDALLRQFRDVCHIDRKGDDDKRVQDWNYRATKQAIKNNIAREPRVETVLKGYKESVHLFQVK